LELFRRRRSVRVTVELQEERDREILAWLQRQRNWSEAIRAALRAYVGRERITLETLYEEIKRLEELIAGGDGQSRPAAISPYGDLPGTEEAAENLSQLGSW
jgi:Arc/MetJ-type ribon-helix-helix transcriptional regulator